MFFTGEPQHGQHHAALLSSTAKLRVEGEAYQVISFGGSEGGTGCESESDFESERKSDVGRLQCTVMK